VKADLADRFGQWLAGPQGQALIGEFKLMGQPLFFPGRAVKARWISSFRVCSGLCAAAGGDPETYSAVFATVKVSSMAMAASLLIGIPTGLCPGPFHLSRQKPGAAGGGHPAGPAHGLHRADRLRLFVPAGPLGHMGLLFTLPGMAIGQTILALPVVIALSATAVESMDADLRTNLLSLGANRRQLLLSSLWEARHGILAAAVTAYGRVMTEVGISMMVGGNIKWHTRTITTAIALETSKGMFAMGIALRPGSAAHRLQRQCRGVVSAQEVKISHERGQTFTNWRTSPTHTPAAPF
jgi:tungstate transport system permease protein